MGKEQVFLGHQKIVPVSLFGHFAWGQFNDAKVPEFSGQGGKRNAEEGEWVTSLLLFL